MLQGFGVLDVSEAQVRTQQGQPGFSAQNAARQARGSRCEALPLPGFYSRQLHGVGCAWKNFTAFIYSIRRVDVASRRELWTL